MAKRCNLHAKIALLDSKPRPASLQQGAFRNRDSWLFQQRPHQGNRPSPDGQRIGAPEEDFSRHIKPEAAKRVNGIHSERRLRWQYFATFSEAFH
jgi:hypothetical protein